MKIEIRWKKKSENVAVRVNNSWEQKMQKRAATKWINLDLFIVY